ncbi:MAG: PHP domain-containing protein [Brevefilum sp.]
MATIDLHMHSNYSSDGEFTPGQLVEMCLGAGLTYAAIADHNSVRGIEAALLAAAGTGLSMIPAIEMDCTFEGITFHLLGYGVDHTAPIFAELEHSLHKQEQDTSLLLMERVRGLGIAFEDGVIAALAFDGVVTGEMIAEAALLYDEKAENPLLDPYRDGGERSDNPFVNFFWDYCSQGKPAYVPMDYLSLTEAINVIRANQGVPILAHPGLQIGENAQVLARLIEAGVAGLEVYSSYHTAEQVRLYRQVVEAQHLLMTCGSDFHGKTKQSITIGGIDAEGQEGAIVTALFDAMGQS